MSRYASADRTIPLDQVQPSTPGKHPALLLLHGSGGSVSFWLDRLGPTLSRFGIAAFAPHYFAKTGTARATPELILDGLHFPAWLATIHDAVSHISTLPWVDPKRIGVLGISLGGYLAMALATEDTRLRVAIELSGGMPPAWAPRVTSDMPPTLILHGDQDTTVPVSEAHALDRLLTMRIVPHQLEIFPGETHWFSGGAQLRLLLTCASFLGKHL